MPISLSKGTEMGNGNWKGIGRRRKELRDLGLGRTSFHRLMVSRTV